MKDDIKAGDQMEVTRQEVYDDYVKWYLQCTEVRLCRDACLLDTAARYLQREPEPSGTFTVFPFYSSLIDGCATLSTDCRRLLSDFIKAVELLETLCVNLFLQPWKKEIKTLKTFTGPFVYCLLPVFSSSAIQSVLASIGYLPHTDTQQSEYRLSEDANPDRAMLVGFELLLARAECYQLLELLDKDQPGPQKWLELLQRRVHASKLEEPTEKKTEIVHKEEEEEEEEKEEADREEVPQCLDSRLAVKPPLKPRHCHLISVDRSIMEMQMTYPDLAIRGRPLLPDKPHRANSTRGSSKAVHTASTSDSSDDSKAAGLHRRDIIKDTKAVATTTCSKNYGSKAADVFGEDGRSSGQTSVPGDAISNNFSNTDEPGHPQAVSLHITLRAGSTAEKRLKPGDTQPTADPQDKRVTSPGPPSMSSMDEERELRELAEKMGQLHVHEAKEESKRKKENERGEESTNKERRKKERKASTGREAEEQNLRRPVIETGPAPSPAARRCSRSSQSDPAVMKEQRKPSALTVSTADCQSCRGGSTGRQEGEDTERSEAGRGEEEQLTNTYVIL